MKAALFALYASPLFWPIVAPLVVWPLLTALTSFFHTKIEPKYPKLVGFLKAAGVDLPHAWSWLRGIDPRIPALPLTLLALAFLSGCASNYDALRGAVDVANGVATLESDAAPIVHTQCVAPMQLLAAEDPASAGHLERLRALEKKCDPLVGAYDGVRRAHLLVLHAVAQAETGQITLGAVFRFVEQLTQSAYALEKEIAQ